MSDDAPLIGDRYGIFVGDCRAVLRRMPENSVDAVVTDPPYGLGFMGVAWDTFDSRKGGSRTDAAFDHVGGNHNPANSKDAARTARSENVKFQAWCEEWAREVLRVLKPGGHALVFGGTRTYHRLSCGLEDAGFEIRDCIQWIYGSGFPKSLDASKALDKAAGAEPVIVAEGEPVKRMIPGADQVETGSWIKDADREYVPRKTEPSTEEAKRFAGYGTALKPAHEPILVARKPLIGTVARNLREYGTGAINVDGCRIAAQGRPLRVQPSERGPSKNCYGDGLYGSCAEGTFDLGRWPANVIFDEDAAAALDAQSGNLKSGDPGDYVKPGKQKNCYGKYGSMSLTGYGDEGGASRFFYCAKAKNADRNYGLPEGVESKHPTVKPTSLMRYLARLVIPPGGEAVVLDPFAGSGTTGIGVVLEGGRFVGIERDASYADLARQRVAAAEAERAAVSCAAHNSPAKKRRPGAAKKKSSMT